MKKNTTKRGFTLIELMTVIIILGILATVLIVKVPDIIDNARRKAAKTEMQAVSTSAKAFYNDFKYYPYSWECYVMCPEITDQVYDNSNANQAISAIETDWTNDTLKDKYKGSPYIEGDMEEFSKGPWGDEYERVYIKEADVESKKRYGLALKCKTIVDKPDAEFDGIVFLRVDGTKR